MKLLLSSLALMLASITSIHAAISVGFSGSGVITFDSQPAVSNGWSTLLHGGGNGTITNETQLDAQVQTNVASALVTQVGSSPTVSPSISSASIPRWNSSNSNLQSVATTAGYLTLLATLQNDTGANLNSLTISFDLGEQHAAGSTVLEEVPGLRVYYSLTGQASSWTVIPALSGASPGTVSTVVFFGSTWASGNPLYILWADDNANANRDNAGDEEGGYTLDNVSFSGVVSDSVTITAPTNGATFPQGVPIVVSANATMSNPVTNVAFFRNGALIGNDGTAPYSVVLSNASLGTHTLSAQATDSTGASVSSTSSVQITVVTNNPPSITITNPANGRTFLVGANITNQVSVADSDGVVTRVEFYVNGNLAYTDNTAPFRFEMCDALVGTHIIRAVATDDGGLRATNSVTIFVVDPPNVTWFVSNGSSWKYLDNGTDQGTAWQSPSFDHGSWSNGVAELGYGDIADDRPERTVVGFGLNPNAKYATTYFRKGFHVSDLSPFTNVVLHVLRDDHVSVYLNGNPIFTDITNNPLTYATYTAPAVANDGVLYVTTNISLGVLSVGSNVITAEVHQDSGTSSDISFDLMLGGAGDPKPQIRIALDTNNAVRLDWYPPDWRLQFTTNVGQPVWSDVSGNSPQVLGVTTDKSFYRAVSSNGTMCTPEVVGFVKLPLLPGTNLIANPFDGTNNHLNTILPLTTDGTQNGVKIYRWNISQQVYSAPITWSGASGWLSSDPLENYILNPGQGVLFQNTLSNSFDVILVGMVRQGNVTNTVPSNYSLFASPVPVTAPIDQLGCPPIDGMIVYVFDPIAQAYYPYQYIGGWTPSVPIIHPGRSVFINNPGPSSACTRTFSIPCGGVALPQIVQQPQSQSVLVGNDATFSVIANGAPPLSYRWFFAGNPIAGATAPSFTRANAQYAHGGNYFVVVSNNSGAVTSSVAVLKVYGPIVINEWMAANNGIVRDPADNDPDDWIELYNAGPTPVDLSGYRLTDNLANSNMFVISNGTSIASGSYLLFWADGETGQGANHLNFNLNASGEQIGLFTAAGLLMDSVSFSNEVGDISSGRAPNGSPNIVSFSRPTPQGGTPTLPVITQQPSNQIAACYGSATFSVQVSGALPLSYEWRRNGCEPMVGANSPTLTLSNVTLADIGNYSVTVSNAFGRVTSHDASLTVNPPTVRPRLTIANGTNIVITWPRSCLDFSLDQTLSLNSPIQWSHPGTLVGSNGTNLSVTLPLRSAQGFFRLSTPATRILEHPRGGTLSLGQDVTLSVVATGAPPTTYQWRLNGHDLDGRTNNVLEFTVVDNSSYGLYEVIVQGPDMAILSEPAVIRPAGAETIAADNFSESTLLPLNNGSVHGNTFGATVESGEPVHAGVAGGQTVWFSWRPTGNGIATFDTIGSGFDTVLAVYTGSSLASLARLVSDDDSTEFLWSRVQFNAVSNAEYRIAIDGVAGAGGFFVLNWGLENTSSTVPIIVTQPQDLVVRSNETAVLTVVATNPSPATILTYQWFRNAAPVSGQTGPQLIVPAVQLQQLGEYYVVVSNGQRAVQSRAALLQMSSNPNELRFVTKLNFDFICGTDVGQIQGDRKKAMPILKLAPSSFGTISSSLITTYSGGAGCPPYICTRRNYYKWTAVTTDCPEGTQTTMSFNMIGSTGTGNTTLAGYYITTDLYLACATGSSSTTQPSISFTAIPGRTYRVLMGRQNNAATLVLNYTNSPCAAP
jgi:hypothetical protein